MGWVRCWSNRSGSVAARSCRSGYLRVWLNLFGKVCVVGCVVGFGRSSSPRLVELLEKSSKVCMGE